MHYQVSCECGATIGVDAGAAGTKVPCGCGRELKVPSLVALKRLAGEDALSPTLLIEHMLARGEVSEGTVCLRCGTGTTNVAHVWVNCERAQVRRPGWRGWTLNPVTLLTFFFGAWLIFQRSSEVQVLGQDVQYRLPLRVCQACCGQLRKTSAIKETLEQVPLYRRLLEKYPRAHVSALL